MKTQNKKADRLSEGKSLLIIFGIIALLFLLFTLAGMSFADTFNRLKN